MTHARCLFTTVLSALLSASIGCTHAPQPAPAPPKDRMVFKRDLYKGKGCLEYSWVPEGKRRVITLNPDIKEGVGEGPTSNEASHVQVYALTNGLYGLKEWQFPKGSPTSSQVVSAMVELKELEAIGTVFYADGSSATDKRGLQPVHIKCPSALPADAEPPEK